MEERIHKLQELKIMVSALEGKINELEEEVKAYMIEKGADALEGDTYRVSWKAVTTNRFDCKYFRACFPEVYANFSKPQTIRRFVLM